MGHYPFITFYVAHHESNGIFPKSHKEWSQNCQILSLEILGVLHNFLQSNSELMF